MTIEVRKDSLVLYKHEAALVIEAADKLKVQLQNKRVKSVRFKDVIALHPGPVGNLNELKILEGDVETAWEMLSGSTTNVQELAELIFEEFTPSSAWSAWLLVKEGRFFRGLPHQIKVWSARDLEREGAEKALKLVEAQNWSSFIKRLHQNRFIDQDRTYLTSIESFALGRGGKCRALKDLGRQGTPENAHTLLLKLKYWDEHQNPYPTRFELPQEPPNLKLPALQQEERRNLTELCAFAIDDEDTQDPDDAISLDGERIWVHVADVAALAEPDSDLDREARARGSNLYLPTGITPILPLKATQVLGLGLQEISPALSFGFRVSEKGEIDDIEIAPTWIKALRMSYAEANRRLQEEPLRTLTLMAERFRHRRFAAGAATIQLPEVKIRVNNGEIFIKPLPRLESRKMVTDVMLMAGEAASRFALAHNIPFPFTVQSPPERFEDPQNISEMFAYRKLFKRSCTQTLAEPHSGLGLPTYARATSPLRRYLDLVVHQQLRAFLGHKPVLSAKQVLERVGEAGAASDSVRQVERYSNRHWTLVYLSQRPHWTGEAIVADARGNRAVILIPELGLETHIHLNNPLLDQKIRVFSPKVNLAELSVSFQVES